MSFVAEICSQVMCLVRDAEMYRFAVLAEISGPAIFSIGMAFYS